MPFDPLLAAIRFGHGLSPRLAPPASPEAMLAALAGPDEAASAFPLEPYATARPSLGDYARAARAAREEGSPGARERLLGPVKDGAKEARAARFRATMARAVAAEDALRERLVLFWADHFTVKGRNAFATSLVAPFVEEAVRPHVAGRFGDMLWAVETHPMMLLYLDGARSVGPGSRAGRRRGRGLNENLAREMLELHTLGVGGPYGQGDVRELAELLTGLALEDGRLAFVPARAEPGAETVLGVTYPARADLATVRAALSDLAVHPATAAHLARKLAVHFVGDAPDAGLVGALAEAWLASGGDLLVVTGALLGHEGAWEPRLGKVKPPFGLVASGLRALGVGPEAIMALDRGATRRLLLDPMTVMGQPWEEPRGPDGWPEEAGAWVTPQGLAGRIDWAMTAPEALLPDLPDPRDLVGWALGPWAPPEVVRAARAAERLSEGVGVVLASPAFQRR